MERLVIDRLGHLGDGIAQTAAGPVYAAMTLPGEEIAWNGEARIAAPKVLVPSPERVRPPCPQFRACGGCLVQHASDGFVARWKAGIVAGALAGQGLGGEIARVETSPPATRRRAVLSGRRTKTGALVGFHARGSDTIVAIPGCTVLAPELMAALPAAEALTLAGGSRKGALSLAMTLGEGGVEIAVSGGKALDLRLFSALAALAEGYDLACLTWEGEIVAARRPGVQRMGRARVVPPPGAFLQATREGEAALVAEVRRIVGGAGPVVDLFAGCGTFTLPLAETAEVHAVEGEAAMLAALEAGWRGAGGLEGAGLRRVTTEPRDLFRRPLLPEELARFAAAVIDPPRAGAAAQVAQIAASRLARLAYVSCNPASFARDAKVLVEAGFAMAPIVVVDQFRWSGHVELVTAFCR